MIPWGDIPETMETKAHRLRRVVLTRESLEHLLQNDLTLTHELPPDTRVHSVFTDQAKQTFEVIVHSKAFNPIMEGETIPTVSFSVHVEAGSAQVPDDPYDPDPDSTEETPALGAWETDR